MKVNMVLTGQVRPTEMDGQASRKTTTTQTKMAKAGRLKGRKSPALRPARLSSPPSGGTTVLDPSRLVRAALNSLRIDHFLGSGGGPPKTLSQDPIVRLSHKTRSKLIHSGDCNIFQTGLSVPPAAADPPLFSLGPSGRRSSLPGVADGLQGLFDLA